MALNGSPLIELLNEFELTETTESTCLLTQRSFQELINAEAKAVIGAAPTSETATVSRIAMARGPVS